MLKLSQETDTVGEYAFQILNNNFSGAVHSVFPHAINIVTSKGTLLVLLEFEEAPWAITLGHEADFIESGISPCCRVAIFDRFLTFDSIASLDLREAKIWQWKTSRHDSRLSSMTLQRSIGSVIAVLSVQHQAGWARLLLTENENRVTIDFAEFAKPRVAGLLEAINNRQLDQVQKHSSEVAGLGIGFTPSGDDFLIGLMLALRWFTCVSNLDYVNHVCSAVLAGAQGRTSIISQNLIEYSSVGMTSRTMLDFLCSFLECDNNLISRTLNVLRHGGTSGEDTLAGVISGATISLDLLDNPKT